MHHFGELLTVITAGGTIPNGYIREINLNDKKFIGFSQPEPAASHLSSYIFIACCENGQFINPHKTYKITFDIMGTPAEGLPASFGHYEDSYFGYFDVTEEWKRITIEFTYNNDGMGSFIYLNLNTYIGTLYITNVFVYDALHTPELPDLPTENPTTIPLGLEIAAPIAIGSSLQLTPVMIPNTAVPTELEWISKNENVAIVADGLVTGVSKGITDIYSTVKGEWMSSNKIRVYVYDAEPEAVPVSTITIDPMVIEDAVTGDQIQLTATVMPENADDRSITWSSSKDEVATVDDTGLVTIVAPGTAVITATANDGSGIKGVCLISGLSGMNEIIYIHNSEIKDVYTVDGKLVMPAATRDDIRSLPRGIYLIGNQKIAVK